MSDIVFGSSRLQLTIGIDEVTGRAFIKSFMPTALNAVKGMTIGEPYSSSGDYHLHPMVEIHVAGDDTPHHNLKHNSTQAGRELKYHSHEISADGKELKLNLRSERFAVTQHLRFATESVLQSWVEVTNLSAQVQTLEYVSSFTLFNIDGCAHSSWDKFLKFDIPYNSWCAECQWQELTPAMMSLIPAYETPLRYSAALTNPEFKRISYNDYTYSRAGFTSTGCQTTGQTAPCAVIRNTALNCALFFQIEHNGSWQWECADYKSHLYLSLSGPNYTENHWAKGLKPNETFCTVPVAVGMCVDASSPNRALIELNRYRRTIQPTRADSADLSIIFNDYMNCLMGDPTTEKILPLVDKAAEIGCKYFCVDCGWYADGWWWNGVGEWLPSKKRFPNGIEEVMNYIRNKGLIPGLWLEIEVMGTKCALAHQLPDECFLMRHGKRVISEDRYHLDFRHPLTIKHADAVIKRLVEEYGVGYIKMDYNIESGDGTEVDADSTGDGLLQHNRAYIKWLEGVFAKYPDLVIENCGSGGTRMDYAMLKQHSVQSVTDQTDYRLMSNIAAAAAALVTPEQAAIWAYPLVSADREEVITNMVNAMLLRIHLSSFLNQHSPENLALIKEGLDTYKAISHDIKNGDPVWPLGLPKFNDPWLSFGLHCGNKLYLAVWKKNTTETLKNIDLPLGLQAQSVRCLYPANDPTFVTLTGDGHSFAIELKELFSARLLEFQLV